MSVVRIGTRKSLLAMEQARLVGEGVRARCPGFAYELVGLTTTGDRIQDKPLDKIGGKGLFVRELDRALVTGEIDAAVHSLKDLPAELDPRIRVAGFSPREDPRDVLALPRTAAGTPLPGAPDPRDVRALAAWLQARRLPVGCSSARRRLQLQALLPGVPVEPVRGFVNTRRAQRDHGPYGARVLAAAGRERLGLAARIDRALAPEEMLPSAGQGIVPATVRADDRASWMDGYSDEDASACGRAERAFTRALGADCAMPCAAYAVPRGEGSLWLRGLYATPDGRICLRDEAVLARDACEEEAAALARSLL